MPYGLQATMMKYPCLLMLASGITMGIILPDAEAVNYDESKVPKYELPDPLLLADA